MDRQEKDESQSYPLMDQLIAFIEQYTHIDKLRTVEADLGVDALSDAGFRSSHCEELSPDVQSQSAFSDVQSQSAFSDVQSQSAFSDVQSQSAFSGVQSQSAFSDVQSQSAFSDVQSQSAFSDVQSQSAFASVLLESPVTEALPQNTPRCEVCAKKTSGCHYGVLSCEGCKGFFKRYGEGENEFICYGGGNCRLTDGYRRCQSCRLKKCREVGMTRDAKRVRRSAPQSSTDSNGSERAASTAIALPAPGPLPEWEG